MSWRLAGSLVKLREQVNTAYPNRSKASDGTIGDAAHAASTSDHNPNAAGVVCALDITHDPANGLDIWTLANQIKADPRVKYLICNAQVYIDGRWQQYNGDNPHNTHLHVSVGNNYDDGSKWPLKGEQMFTRENVKVWFPHFVGRDANANDLAFADKYIANNDLMGYLDQGIIHHSARPAGGVHQGLARIKELEAQLQAEGTVLQPGKYIVK